MIDYIQLYIYDPLFFFKCSGDTIINLFITTCTIKDNSNSFLFFLLSPLLNFFIMLEISPALYKLKKSKHAQKGRGKSINFRHQV